MRALRVDADGAADGALAYMLDSSVLSFGSHSPRAGGLTTWRSRSHTTTRGVTPYLYVDGATARSTSTARCSAHERMRMAGPDGRVGHAELQLGDSMSCWPTRTRTWACAGPGRRRHPGVAARVRRGRRRRVRPGDPGRRQRRLRPMEDQFYGDRSGQFADRSATAGTSPPTSRTCRPRRWRSAPLRRWPPTEQPLADRPGVRDFKLHAISATDNPAVHTVLVVDDEPIVRDVVVRYLERDGYKTLEAASGDEATGPARARVARRWSCWT